MRIIIITGISGAGKGSATKYLEDAGFFCIDNLPPLLIPKIADICNKSDGKIDKIAFVVDIRGRELFNDLFSGLHALKDSGYDYEILFLDASDQVVIKRYKESRRIHPLAPEGRLQKGITEERKIMQRIKEKADYIIDTSNLIPRQLKEEIKNIISESKTYNSVMVNIISFGYKYGIPVDCDLVFDVRFIPNPYYVESMKRLNGKDENVKKFIFNMTETTEFIKKLEDMLDFLIPNYLKEGKVQLVIGIGCTGGRHRSVAIADALNEILIKKQYKVIIDHRDIEKDRRGAEA